jgi:hypothetical protein
LQESSQLQGELQELGQQVQDLTHQLLEAQNAKVWDACAASKS